MSTANGVTYIKLGGAIAPALVTVQTPVLAEFTYLPQEMLEMIITNNTQGMAWLEGSVVITMVKLGTITLKSQCYVSHT